MDKIYNTPIDQYLKGTYGHKREWVLELVKRMEEGTGMKKDDMELVVNHTAGGDSISIVSLTLNPHLREPVRSHDR